MLGDRIGLDLNEPQLEPEPEPAKKVGHPAEITMLV